MLYYTYMTKIQNNKILNILVMGLFILLILGLGFIALVPMKTHASGYSYSYSTSRYYGGTGATDNYHDNTNYNYNSGSNNSAQENPVPSISYVDPSSSAPKTVTVTVRGSNFIPSSQVRFDNSPRPTTYVSSIRLLVTLTASDLSAAGTHVITVVNPGPGGGVSNGVYFTAKVASQGSVLGASTSRGAYSPVVDGTSGQQLTDLTANVLLGNGSFLPTGIIGWIILAILILIIVLLVRKFLGLDKKYQSTPLKHS